MGRVKRVEIMLGLSWLLAAACGGAAMGPAETIDQFNPFTGSNPNNPGVPSAAGSTAMSAGIARASARIEPLAVAPATPAATPSTGAAGTTAGAAGASAVAGTSAAGAGAQAGTSATGSGGSGGTGTGAGYAAGSGGDAGSTTAAAGSGAAGTSVPATGAAGVAAAPATGAAGVASPAPGGRAGAGAVEAPANIMGTASFASSANGVNLTVMVSGCQSGKEYPIHIHQGSSCESATTQGGHWDMTRGEGIPNIRCGGRQGATTLQRAKTDATLAWSVGDGSASDVVGRTIVIHDADDPTIRIACGPITKN